MVKLRWPRISRSAGSAPPRMTNQGEVMQEPVEGDVEPGDRDRSLKGLPGTLGRPQAPDSTFRWLQADQQVVDDPTHRHLASATVPTWFGS